MDWSTVPTDDSSSPLSIRLFGELELWLGGQLLPRVDSARARSLLAFLLLHRDAPQSRHRLAFMLWPDSSEKQALTNLRHLIHNLRQASPALEQYLEVKARTLRWRQDSTSWIDVAAFEAAQAGADAPGVTARHQLEALRASVELYRGDLLEGCYDEWVLDVRERLRDRYLSHLGRLAEVLADDGEHAEAIRVGRELLRTEPLHEQAYRFLMGVHVAAGDPTAAVRVFHECVSTFERELGVEPSAEAVATYEALMRRTEEAPAESQPTRIPGSVLVGRDAEWNELVAQWRDAEKGSAHLVLITGEPGVGKTRLAEEFATWCGRRGALVAAARSYATEGSLGFGAVISWLRTPDIADQLREAPSTELARLGRLLPEFDDVSWHAVPAFDAAEERARMFEAVAKTLGAVGRPVLLIADDLQWCDEQSVQLMHYLVRLDASNPILVLATARSEDLEHSLAGPMVEGLRVLDRTTEIRVERLSRAGTEQLARNLVRSDFDPSSLDHLHADTEGNPLFIVETVRAGWSGEQRTATKLSPKLHAVIAGRLRNLTSRAHDVLGVAATVGREFNANVLARAMGLDDLTLVACLDELWRRGIIREHGIDAYDFAHGKIRDVAYGALSPATLRRNHREIAEAMVALAGPDPDEFSGEIARHFDRGGRSSEAARWYRRAAGQAQRVHADADAIKLLDRAGELVAAMPVGDTRTEHEYAVLSALVTPLAVIDGFASTRLADAQTRSLELAAMLHLEPEPSLLRSVAMSNLCGAIFGEAEQVALRLRSVADRKGDDVLRVESQYLLGIGAFWDGRFDVARSHFETVVAQFDPARRLEHLVRFGQDPHVVCLSRLANTLWFLGLTDDARATCDDAVRLAMEVGHPFSQGVAIIFASLLCVDLEEPERLRGLLDKVLGDTGRPFAVATEAIAGYLDVIEGRSDEGIRRIRRTVAESSATPSAIDHAPGQRAAHARLLIGAYHAAGRAEAGLAAADDALRAKGTRIWEPELRRLRATFLAALDSPPELVEAELLRAHSVAEQFGAVGPMRRIARTRRNG